MKSPLSAYQRIILLLLFRVVFIYFFSTYRHNVNNSILLYTSSYYYYTQITRKYIPNELIGMARLNRLFEKHLDWCTSEREFFSRRNFYVGPGRRLSRIRNFIRRTYHPFFGKTELVRRSFRIFRGHVVVMLIYYF